MRNKNALLYLGGFCTSIFFGCGGEGNTSSMNTDIGPVKGTGPITKNILETMDGKVSNSLRRVIQQIEIKDIKQSNVDDIVALMNNNYAFKINIEYSFYHDTKSRKKYCYSSMKANNKLIGESFILFNSGGYEGATRIISKDVNKYDGTALFVSPVSNLWNNYNDKNIINNSLSSINSHTRNHSVSFDFKYENNGDYHISNCHVSNATGYKNSYTLNHNKRSNYNRIANIKETELLLTSLFVNFNESYSVLD